MTDWKPIETAPKIEAVRILVVDRGNVEIASWHFWRFMRPAEIRTDGSWIADHDVSDAEYALLYPTHWMPLPEPPK